MSTITRTATLVHTSPNSWEIAVCDHHIWINDHKSLSAAGPAAIQALAEHGWQATSDWTPTDEETVWQIQVQDRREEYIAQVMRKVMAMADEDLVDRDEFLEHRVADVQDILRSAESHRESLRLDAKGALRMQGVVTIPGMILWNSRNDHRDAEVLKKMPYYLVEEVDGRISATEVSYYDRRAPEGAVWTPVLELEAALRGEHKSAALQDAKRLLESLDNGWN